MLKTSLTTQHIKISLVPYHLCHNQNIVCVPTLSVDTDDPNNSFVQLLLSATKIKDEIFTHNENKIITGDTCVIICKVGESSAD